MPKITKLCLMIVCVPHSYLKEPMAAFAHMAIICWCPSRLVMQFRFGIEHDRTVPHVQYHVEVVGQTRMARYGSRENTGFDVVRVRCPCSTTKIQRQSQYEPKHEVFVAGGRPVQAPDRECWFPRQDISPAAAYNSRPRVCILTLVST